MKRLRSIKRIIIKAPLPPTIEDIAKAHKGLNDLNIVNVLTKEQVEQILQNLK